MVRLAVAIAALAAAAVLAVFAVDIGHWERAIAADDAEYQVRPYAADWRVSGIVPGRLVPRLLGASDDLTYRRAVNDFAAIYTRRNTAVGPRLAVLVGDAQKSLIEVSQTDPDPRRRAQLTNLLGVLAALGLTGTSFRPDVQTLDAAVRSFRAAVELDSGNADARRNLEIALRLYREASLVPADDPSGRGRGKGRGAGAGETGGGY